MAILKARTNKLVRGGDRGDRGKAEMGTDKLRDNIFQFADILTGTRRDNGRRDLREREKKKRHEFVLIMLSL